MNREFTFFTILFSAIGVIVAALAVCLILYFFIFKPVQTAESEPLPDSGIFPESEATPIPNLPQPDIKLTDVDSVTLKTAYKDYFENNSKCRKTYNELFGEHDGVYSSNSPCLITLSFSRGESAVKTITISRYDKTSKKWRETESNRWTSTFTKEEFNELAEFIINSPTFKNWIEGTSIYISNSSITVSSKKGEKTPMSNVNEQTTNFLSLLDAFKKLDNRIRWKKVK